MLLDSDINQSSPEDRDVPSKAWAITAGACMLPIYIVFSLFGMVGKGTAAALAAGTLVLAVKMHARFMGHLWFWAVIVLATILNACLIAFIPLPNRNYTFAIAAPFGYAEYLLIALCIGLIAKRVRAA